MDALISSMSSSSLSPSIDDAKDELVGVSSNSDVGVSGLPSDCALLSLEHT